MRDLAAIETFCRAIEDGNLTRAANSLHITKSVASRRIRALEDSLGVKLLNRNTRGVTPTDEGLVYYERCTKILEDLEEAGQAIQQTETHLTGTLRITAPFDYANLHLAEPMSAFLALHPDLKLEMQSTDAKTDIIAGGFDMGLRITGDLVDSSLKARKIAPVHSHVLASPDYLKQHGTPQHPDDLKDHNCIFYSNISVSEQWRFHMGGTGTESVRVKGRITVNSGMLQMAMARNGLGIAALPDFFCHRAIESGELVTILTDYPRPEIFLYALYPESKHSQAKVRALIDFLLEWNKTHSHNIDGSYS
ncbi:LysR family transcriptional regulator [Kordiimonas sediminis]|uniref:LysR family transcriptional regulator n=1 Tax=Kordiimonas sediminis TaxID=1735581 RepID=A0A919E384_9PROT|nr:LysR family transcriptional regulator [Kordiimonas sediminis]GHF15041.1 LysR family transcriptional regulator [Kordiimonas sediminis]